MRLQGGGEHLDASLGGLDFSVLGVPHGAHLGGPVELRARRVAVGAGAHCVVRCPGSASRRSADELFTLEHDADGRRLFLVIEDPCLRAAGLPGEAGLQWGGDGLLLPGQPLGRLHGLVLSESEEEDYWEALGELLAPFGGIAPSNYCFAVRRDGGRGWQLLDSLEAS